MNMIRCVDSTDYSNPQTINKYKKWENRTILRGWS